MQTVLIVDDEEDLQALIKMQLELDLPDTRILTAFGGVEAYDIVLGEHVDVVISDIRMPGGDGVDLLRKLRARNPEAPKTIVMTGFAVQSAAEILAAGALTILYKPFELEEMVALVRKALNDLTEENA